MKVTEGASKKLAAARPSQAGSGGNYDARRALGVGGGGSAPASGVSQSFIDRYRQIKAASSGDRGDTEISSPGQSGRRGDAVDHFIAGMGRIGDEIQSWSGQEEAAKTDTPVDDAFSFLGGLVTGTFSAPFTGVAQLGEAITGHRATEMDESGFIPDDDLDLGQRLATGASGAINVIGPRFGGSWEMLKGGKRAVQAGIGAAGASAGKKWGSDMLESAVKKATADTAERSFGRKLAGDMLEEGMEEFVQSPLDEIRAGTFDDDWLSRAAEAGAYGALGGGIMSGVGQGINYGLSKLSKPSDARPTDEGRQKASEPGAMYGIDRFGFNRDKLGEMLPDAQESAVESLRNRTTAPGSASVLQVSTGNGHGMNTGDVGADVFREIFYKPDNGRSATFVADWFGTDLNTMAQIMASGDYATRLGELHEANKANGTDKVLKLGRNPATEKVGRYDIDVDNIVEGGYLDLSPMAYNFVKSDVDGDKITVYLDPAVTTEGYITRRLENSVAADWNDEKQRYERKSNVEFTNFSFMPKSYSKDRAREIFSETFDRVVGQQDAVSSDAYADEMVDHIGNWDDADYARFFSSLMREVERAKSEGKIPEGVSSDRLASELMRELATTPEAMMLRTVEHDIDDLRTQVRELSDSVVSMSRTVTSENPNDRGYVTDGALPDITDSLVRLWTKYNLVSAKYSTGATNVLFREDGAMVMQGQARELRRISSELERIASEVDPNGSAGVFQKVLSITIKQAELGGDIINNVSGMFDSIVRSQVMIRSLSRMGGAPQTGQQMRDMLSTFREEWNRIVPAYRRAVEQMTTQGIQVTDGVATKPELKKSDPLDIENVRYFVETFGDVDMRRILPTERSRGLEGHTLSSWLDAYVEGGRTDRTQFGGMDAEFQQFIDGAISGRMARQIAVEQRFSTFADNIAPILRRLYDGGLDKADRAEAEYVLTAIRRLFDPEVANRLGLVSVDNLSTGRWGRELTSGDPGRVRNVILSMALVGKYDTLIRYAREAKRLLKAGRDERAEAMLLRARNEAGRLALMSRLDTLIVAEAYESLKSLDALAERDVVSVTYDALTDLDISYEEKVRELSLNDASNGIRVISDALSTDSNGVGASGLSSKMSRADSQLSAAARASRARNLTLWEGIRENFMATERESQAANAIVDLLTDSYYDNSIDVVSGAIYATTTLANAFKEKGMTPLASQMLYQAAEMNLNGALQSFSAKVFGRSLGEISLEDFNSNPRLMLEILMNPDSSIRVVDGTTQRSGRYDRASLIREATGDPNASSELTFSNLDAIFTKWPQLLTLLPEQELTPSIGEGESKPNLVPKNKRSVMSSILNRMGEVGAVRHTKDMRYREGSTYAHRRSKKIAQAMILSDTDVISVLIRRMGDISGRELSLPEIQRRMRRVFDDYVEGVLEIATNGESETRVSANINKLRRSQAIQLSRSITSAYNTAAAMAGLGEAETNLANALYSDLRGNLDNVFLDSIVRDVITGVAGDQATASAALREYSSNAGVIAGRDADQAVFTAEAAQRDAEELMSLMYAAFPIDLNPEISVSDTFSEDLVDAAIDRVNSIEALDADQKAKVIDVLTDRATARVTPVRSAFDFSDRVLQYADFDMDVRVEMAHNRKGKVVERVIVDRARLDALVDKIMRMNSEHNWADPESVEGLRETCRSIVTGLKSQSPETVSRSQRDMSELMRKWNALVVKTFVGQKRLASRGDANPNLLNAYYEDTVALERMIKKVRNGLQEAGLPISYPEVKLSSRATIVMEGPDFADPVKDIMANRAKVNTTRGPAAITVGLNGAGNRDREGLTLIPRNHHTELPPTPMTIDDIVSETGTDSAFNGEPVENWNRFLGARYLSEGDFKPGSEIDGKMPYKTKVITRSTIANLEANPDTVIYVFDPLDSPNGIDVEHSYPSFSGDIRSSLRVLQEIGMMGDGTQEGLALKSSKTVGNVDSIASKTTEDYMLTHAEAVDPSVFGDAAALRARLRETMRTFRREYAAYLNRVFADESNSVLGLGPMQALDFARLLTPYFEVECENGSTVINASDVFAPSDAQLAKRLDAIGQAGLGQIVSIKPVSVTPETMSARIARKISDETVRLGKQPKVGEAEKIALKAVQDWSDFGVGKLSIDDMMSGFRGASQATVPYMIGDDAQSVYNKFIDDVYGGNAGTTVPGMIGVGRSRGVDVDNGIYVSHALTFESTASPTMTMGDGTPAGEPWFVVFKAFGSQASPDSPLYEISQVANDSGLFRTPDDVNGVVRPASGQGRPRSTVAVVLDVSALADAAQWGSAYHKDILVPIDMLGDARAKILVDCADTSRTVTFRGVAGARDTRFAVISPYRSKELRYVASREGASKSRPLEPADIYINVFNYARYLADAGGVANASTTEGAGTVESPTRTIPKAALFAGLDVTDVSLCDEADVRRIRSMIDSGSDLAPAIVTNENTVSGRGREWVEGQVVQFVMDMTQSREATGTYRTEADRFQVIAMAKGTTASGTTVYAPIMVDGNDPKHITGIRVVDSGTGSVRWSGDAFASIVENEAMKVVVPGVPYKGIIVPTDAGSMTRIAATVGGADLRSDFDLNYKTYSGRVDDMSAQIMLQNLWYSYLKFGGSLLYEQSDGKWVRRKIANVRGERVSNATFDALAEGAWKGGWELVANGQVRFSTDNELNDLIAKIATRAYAEHIPVNYLFSSVVGASGDSDVTTVRGMDVDYMMAMSGMTRYQMLQLFHFMNPQLCPDYSRSEGVVETGKTLLNQFGQIYTLIGDGEKTYIVPMDCVLGPGMSLGHSTTVDRQSFEAKWSMQRQQRGGLETPLTGHEASNVMEDLAISAADARAYDIMEREGESRRISREDSERADGFTPVDIFDPGTIGSFRRLPGYSRWTTYKELLHQRSMLDTAKTFRTNLPIIGFDGGEIDNPDPLTHKHAGTDPHETEVAQIADAMAKVNRALGVGTDSTRGIDWQHFQWLLMYHNGITLNDGVGSFRMTVPEIVRSADQIAASLSRSDNPLPVSVDESRMLTIDDRYSIPLLTPDMAEYMYQFPALRNRYDTMADFRDAMVSESMVARDLIENLVANGTTSRRAHKAKLKRDALFKFLDWTFRENGMQEVSGHVYGDEYVSDIVMRESAFWSKIFGSPEGKADRDLMIAESERTAQHLADLNKLRQTRTNTFEDGDYRTVSVLGSDAGTINSVLDFLTRVSQTMAILSPSVAFSNIVDKGIHTNLTFAALAMGRHGVGPYNTDVQVSQDAVKMFAEDPIVQKVFVAYRMAMIDGDVASLVSVVDNEQQLDAWLKQKSQQGGAFRKLSDLAFNLANGGNIFMNRQLRNFANYFFMVEHDAGHDWWFHKNPDGVTMADAQLGGHNPQHFILDVLMGRNNNASFGNAQVAMNFALQGDMAQRNLLSMLYQEAVRRYGSSVKFLTSTFLSRFFVYRTNQIGRVLNTVMPISSLNFLATNWVAKNTEIGRSIHVEDAQVFTQFKRAAMADAMHMAPHLLGIVLAMIPGLLMPPEDEDKRSNPQEWTFAGQRIYTDWELEDILGLSLPIAVFWKSMSEGRLDFNILMNGISQATYNNPMAKAADVIALFGEGDGSLLTSYQQDVEGYADAQGGSPTYSEWLSGKFQAGALSYVGQFITPSFVREFVDSDMEHSYKRIYEETESGVLTEAGQYGETMRTDYTDAQIRKVTRSNPVLGWILDFAFQPNTSFTEEGMPLVEIYDPYVMEQMQSWSINDENGNPLPWDVQEEKILEAISMLQSTDDMEALYQSGFMLDYDTRDAVGDTIWDIITQLTDDYNELKKSGGLNYYNLSPTDPYGEGARLATEINEAYYDEKAYWESLYYDKLMSEPMRRTIPIYNRYKTDYAVDANGEFYATGYHTNTGILASLSPVLTAPGTLSDPGDTLGREGNWETPSVVGNGASTGERALVPTEQGHYDWVDLEAHAASGDGTGYSKRRNGGVDTVSTDDEDDDGDDSNNNGGGGGGGYPRYYRRRGGGGGGGGGGYSPNLYSRLPNLYMPSVRTMYAERVYDPNYDYLRPNFETKGSREAYKRSDI